MYRLLARILALRTKPSAGADADRTGGSPTRATAISTQTGSRIIT